MNEPQKFSSNFIPVAMKIFMGIPSDKKNKKLYR